MAEHNYTYRDPRTLSRLVIGVSGFTALLHFLGALASLNEWALLDAMDRQDFSHLGSPQTAASFVQITSVASLVGVFPTIILFLMWIYRVSANAHTMGAELSHGAGFSVGMFFIPGLNLFLPPMMMSELARASILASSWRSQKRSLLVPLWWSLQLIVSLGGLALGFGSPKRGASVLEFKTYFYWATAYKLSEILLYLVLALLVARVSGNQRQQWREMELAAATFS